MTLGVPGPVTGGGDRIRTDDPLVANQVLCRLSYTPGVPAVYLGGRPLTQDDQRQGNDRYPESGLLDAGGALSGEEDLEQDRDTVGHLEEQAGHGQVDLRGQRETPEPDPAQYAHYDGLTSGTPVGPYRFPSGEDQQQDEGYGGPPSPVLPARSRRHRRSSPAMWR